MLFAMLACTESDTTADGSSSEAATKDTADSESTCAPLPEAYGLPADLVRFDASAPIERARADGKVARTLEVWIISLTNAEYSERICDDTLSPELVKGAVLQDLTEYSWLDVDLAGAEGWSVVAATMSDENETLERWFGEVQLSGDGATTVVL